MVAGRGDIARIGPYYRSDHNEAAVDRAGEYDIYSRNNTAHLLGFPYTARNI